MVYPTTIEISSASLNHKRIETLVADRSAVMSRIERGDVSQLTAHGYAT